MSFDVKKCLEKLGKDPIEKLEPLKDFLISDSSGVFFKYITKSLKDSFEKVFISPINKNSVYIFKKNIQVGGKCAEFAKYAYQVLSSLDKKSFDNLEKIMKINHFITCEVTSRVEANYAQAMGKNEKDVDVRRVSNSEKPDKGYFKVNFPEYNSSYIFRRNEVNREATKDCLTVCVSNFKGNKELKELIKKVKDGHCSGTMVLDYSPDILLIMLKEDDKVIYFNNKKARNLVKKYGKRITNINRRIKNLKEERRKEKNNKEKYDKKITKLKEERKNRIKSKNYWQQKVSEQKRIKRSKSASNLSYNY